DNVLSQEQIEALKAAPGGVQGSQRDQVKYSQVAHEVADEYGYDIVQRQGWTKVPGTSKSVPVFKNTLHQGSHYNDKKSYYDKHGYDVEKSDYEKKQAAAQEKRDMTRWATEEREEARRKGELKITAAKGAVEIDMSDPQLTGDQIEKLSVGKMRQLNRQFSDIYYALKKDLSDDEKERITDKFYYDLDHADARKEKAKVTRKKNQRMVDRGEKEATMTARQKMEDDEKFKKGIKDLKKRHNKKKKPRDGDANGDVDESREERRSSAPIPFETTARAPEDKEGRNAARSAWADIEKYHDEQKKKKKPVLPQQDFDDAILPIPAGMIDVGDYTGEGDEKLDPRQKKRKQGKDFKGYKNTMPYTNRKFYPNMSDEEWKAKQGDDVEEERRILPDPLGGIADDRSGEKDRRDPNIRRSSVPQHYPDYDKKKKEYVVPPKQRKGDDVDEISMQQARKAYGVGQGKTIATKQKQMKGLGGTGSSQRNFAKRHKAIGAKTGQVRKAVGGPKVIAQTQKRKRAAKMSNMVKGLGNIGRKALYG
ncbi:MAG TPA: hypothetical protein QF458_03740, partial [Candidatus Woesearchaeota archaeon]|nr:hypothetical protein [Candidatus Woesearchaeota archaeon]